MERLLSRPNVQWVGPKPFEQLPSYVRAIDVGLVPYADSAFNRGSFPLKTLEYLAAGRPTVATDLPAIRWLDTPTVAMAKDPSEFSHLVVQALSQRPDDSTVAAMRAVAKRNSWDLRAREFGDLLGLSSDSDTDGAMSFEGAIRRTSGKGGET
jgi:teichuronic acid biosynthesis glycosyltransferase TuaH